jgi:hypothetical protein
MDQRARCTHIDAIVRHNDSQTRYLTTESDDTIETTGKSEVLFVSVSPIDSCCAAYVFVTYIYRGLAYRHPNTFIVSVVRRQQ